MEVVRLALSASQKGKLISAGYTSIESLSSIPPSKLALGIFHLINYYLCMCVIVSSITVTQLKGFIPSVIS